jgi:hypothetical protein
MGRSWHSLPPRGVVPFFKNKSILIYIELLIIYLIFRPDLNHHVLSDYQNTIANLQTLT